MAITTLSNRDFNQHASEAKKAADRGPVSDFYLSAISILELELGVLTIERRDAAQGQVLRG